LGRRDPHLERSRVAAADSRLLDTLRSADQQLVLIAREIRILSQLSWPRKSQRAFLSGRRADRQFPPVIEYPKLILTDTVQALRAAVVNVPEDDPRGRFLRETADSYVTACRMLENLGSPRLTAYSVALYGQPGDSLAGGAVHNIDAARYFLDVSTAYVPEGKRDTAIAPLSSEAFSGELTARLAEVLNGQPVRVVVDDNLVSKAAAGANRIRIRGQTEFTTDELEQLLQHEAYVHTLTAINGRRQPQLSALSLPAPRTVGTQEGLATFAELVTGAIDIARLNRVALRILAIDQAMNGADFMDVFRFFLEAGQDENESFYSAMRVFRGVPATGGSAFTKDTVYLHGLMEIHTFFRWALQHRRFELCRYLFAGRMTIGDVINLAPFFDSGFIAGPQYLPPWMQRRTGLAAYLAFSVFANRIPISELGEGYRFDRLDEMGI
jgi:uncharacterized protein (TIGR02421 family)